MIYKTREDLIIIKTDTVLEHISIDLLKSYLIKPNYNIYFECNEVLYGVINVEEILYGQTNKELTIYSDFFRLYTYNFMQAKKLLEDHINLTGFPLCFQNLTEIPILYGEHLLGAYTLGTNYNTLKEIYEFHKDLCDISKKDICFIKSSYFNDKRLEYFKKYFEDKNNKVSIIDYLDYINNDYKYDIFVFESEGVLDNYSYIAPVFKKGFSGGTHFSFKGLLDKYLEYTDDSKISSNILPKFLNYYEEKKVNVYIAYFDYDDYTIDLEEKIKNKYREANTFNGETNIVNPQEFFGEYYSEDYHYKVLSSLPNRRLISKNGVNYLEDFNSDTLNVKDNIRVTTDTINDSCGTIHFFGPCLAIGLYVEDKNTIESYLQRLLNANGIKMNVVNHGSFNSLFSEMEMVKDTEIHEGDTIIFFDLFYKVSGVKKINLSNALKKDIPLTWFVNSIGHVNHKINELYAEEIFKNIKDSLKYNKKRNIITDVMNLKNMFLIDRYFSNIDLSKYDKVGSIVMKCDPFTLGHKYLVNEALKKVDFLIVFVLCDDEFTFKFYERLAMARAAVKDLKNVYVVPTEHAIASKKIFPEYFSRVVDEKLEKNIENDLLNFAVNIAPKLNIKYRFVGTEPIDKVTQKYNELLKKILPDNGIKLIEIKRKEKDKKAISASLVRKLFEEMNYDDLKKYLPESSIDIILDN